MARSNIERFATTTLWDDLYLLSAISSCVNILTSFHVYSIFFLMFLWLLLNDLRVFFLLIYRSNVSYTNWPCAFSLLDYLVRIMCRVFVWSCVFTRKWLESFIRNRFGRFREKLVYSTVRRSCSYSSQSAFEKAKSWEIFFKATWVIASGADTQIDLDGRLDWVYSLVCSKVDRWFQMFEMIKMSIFSQTWNPTVYLALQHQTTVSVMLFEKQNLTSCIYAMKATLLKS